MAARPRERATFNTRFIGNFLVRAVLLVLFFFAVANRTNADFILQQSFTGVQGDNGIYYEAIGDSRSTNTLNPHAPGATLLNYLGSYNFGYPGDVPLLTYAYPGFFPFVQDESANGFLSVHPGTGGYNFGTGTANIGVSIRFVAPVSGLYDLTGAFAKYNPNQGYGDGVDVMVAKNLDLDHPLFSTHISSDNAVDMTNPFAGSGIAPFDLTASLSAGDSVRFIVFSDAQGQDGTFDGTALRGAISAVPEPPGLIGVVAAITALLTKKLWTILADPHRSCRGEQGPGRLG